MSTRSERLQQTKDRLTNYLLAEKKLLEGAQSYSVGNRTLTRGDLEDIRKQIDELTKECSILARNKGIKVQRAVYRDI